MLNNHKNAEKVSYWRTKSHDLPMISPIPSSSFCTGILVVSIPAVSPLDSVRPTEPLDLVTGAILGEEEGLR